MRGSYWRAAYWRAVRAAFPRAAPPPTSRLSLEGAGEHGFHGDGPRIFIEADRA